MTERYETCNTCTYFKSFDAEARERFKIDGHCYRFPPTPILRSPPSLITIDSSAHPPVDDEDYCGEWKSL